MKTESVDSSIHKNQGVSRVFKAFCYSLSGLLTAVKHEAAFRLEVLLAVILISVSFFLNVSLTQHLILIGSVFLVLIVELVNSTIEAVVDDVSLEKRPLAKRAKDMGSAAVFLSLLNCLLAWGAILILH